MSGIDKLKKKVREIENIVSVAIQESAEMSKDEYKRITRENIDKVQTNKWYGWDSDLGQNTGLPVEETIKIVDITVGNGKGSFTIGFREGGGHTSWVSGEKVDVIDILEEGWYTVLASKEGYNRKPPINAHDDTYRFLTEIEGGHPRCIAPIIAALKANGFNIK